MAPTSELVHFFKRGVDDQKSAALLRTSLDAAGVTVLSLEQEHCFNVELISGTKLSAEEEKRLSWLLTETFEPTNFAKCSFFDAKSAVVEVGPRLTFCTAWSSNAVSICIACGIDKVKRIERSRRFAVKTQPALSAAQLTLQASALYDRMTECVYETRLMSFKTDAVAQQVKKIPVMKEGQAALQKVSDELGLGFDEADMAYYTKVFVEELKRDPTDVECFDMGQSNSEHSRHWFFGGIIDINGEKKEQSLFQMVKGTLKASTVNNNSVIAFHDNSSAIKGGPVKVLRPSSNQGAGPFALIDDVYHPILTAETHNFPCGVAPFPGAETGTGGRIRDVHATGRGAFVVAGVSAYCMGNLKIPGYDLPWEDQTFRYPPNLASPLQIQIDASNGASDYGNKFGEPVITGFNRSFGMKLPNGERREWIKPIMFSAGLGQMPECQSAKGQPEPGMWLVKIGGPAYRIGMGGGAASSRADPNEEAARAALDFNAVQRGDAEMENKMNRVIRACTEMGNDNPIVSIHDQGAGGNGNVLKEICDPLGARLQVRSIFSGDETLSVVELWGAEYQENCALLLRPEHADMFRAICARENAVASFVGQVTGDGRVVLEDSKDDSVAVDLPLSLVLGDMPRKTFASKRVKPTLVPISLPEGVTAATALQRVLRLASVGSKRFLTNKVDRSVTGLIAQQQCIGPLHTPLANVGVIAQSHTGVTGAATAVGEQPIKGLLSPEAMARLSVAEALTNLVWAPITALADVKCSANWMWAAKLAGEGAAMWDACEAMAGIMSKVGVAVDGGKDSLSMAAKVGSETVKCPGALVITVYALCTDVNLCVTPDLKSDDGVLMLIDMSCGRRRLGGTAFAQVYGQLGNTPPDVDDPELLARAFGATQQLIREQVLLAGHDVSDGGLITAALEMAFAGDRGLELDLPSVASGADSSGVGLLADLFAEEVMLLVEVAPANIARVSEVMAAANVPCMAIGRTTADKRVRVAVGWTPILDAPMTAMRDVWEETSYELEKLQATPACVEQERQTLKSRHAPAWTLGFTPSPTDLSIIGRASKSAVAVIRQEGSNGDREMAAALFEGGLEPWDVAMSDLISGKATLDRFRGVVFVGGFSYADVFDSAKGWAGVLKFSPGLWEQFQHFRRREDSFSLGVCNGCQLMALLGWVPGSSEDAAEISAEKQPRFVHNKSGRFESRFSSVQVQKSPSVLLRGMEGTSFGVWVAHGEGRAHFPDETVKHRVMAKHLAPLRYVDDDNAVSETYPFNPNGSPDGIAALCSEDGRHLAMMPHPERCFQMWQWPWSPEEWRSQLAASPWLRLFQNARSFCDSTTA